MDKEIKFWHWIIWVVTIVGAILSSLWMIKTFTAESYEYGEIEEVSSNLEFIIQSPTLVLNQDELNSDRYYSEKEYTSVYQVTDFNADENEYYFELNKTRFYSVEMKAGYIKCSLDFTFLDTSGNEICTDKLEITINFYDDSTIVLVESLGGYTASSYWQSYFNANGFDLRVYSE